MSKINLQELQRNRNATAKYVNLIMTSTVGLQILLIHSIICFLKACIILNLKVHVVPNDMFGGERVGPMLP